MPKTKGQIRVDFHCHTEFSSDSRMKIEELIKTRKARGLDKIAITDHNTIEGALIAKELDPEGIIVGEEILTRQGELLAFFVKEALPKGLDAIEVVDELNKQGAFISVSHPFDVTRRPYWTEEELFTIIDKIDAIEGFNSRVTFRKMNKKALQFANEQEIPFTVGSDAHTYYEIGRSSLLLEDFTNADELRYSIRTATPNFRYSPLWVKLFSRYAYTMDKRKS